MALLTGWAHSLLLSLARSWLDEVQASGVSDTGVAWLAVELPDCDIDTFGKVGMISSLEFTVRRSNV